MRIISGTHKGRPIHTPGNLPVRPTTDFAKESLFNILNNRIEIEGLAVLDLFAGTGSISYEFASRGASMITSVDMNFHCTDFIKKTAAVMGFANLKAVKANVFSFLGFYKLRYDLIFADPPYEMQDTILIPDLVMDKKLLNEDGILIIEHSREIDFSKHPAFKEHRNYGKVNFSFFTPVG
jgi:16S rRNA (guanine966-N2)-methyltransferase